MPAAMRRAHCFDSQADSTSDLAMDKAACSRSTLAQASPDAASSSSSLRQLVTSSTYSWCMRCRNRDFFADKSISP